MRVRKLAFAVGLVSALGGNAALALGLGEIKLNSTLNQPLDAEISLLQTRGLDESEIKVRLAGPDDFERAGVERSYLLTGLRFDVDYSSGQPIIRVSSREPIREPFLNFLVETRWPSGRLLREYTLLMDLPAFSTNTAQQPVRAAERERQQVRRDTPVQRPAPQPAVRPAEPAPAAESQQAEAPRPQARQPVVEEVADTVREVETAAPETAPGGSRVYGPVSANQTLWEIALENRVSREFSVQQTMLAIQRLNPEAFINNNINLLKKGAVLRLPSAEDVRALPLTEAISEVASQNDSWRQRIGGDAATGAPLDARAVAEETSAGDAVEGRVSLAAPGDNESVISGSGSGAEDSEALAGELAVTEEELDKSRLENEELQERIAELDEQIDTMERLVEVSNEEMRAVQAAAEQSEPSLDPVGVGESEQAEQSGQAAAEETVSEVADAEAEAVEPEVAAQPEVEEDNNRNRVVSVQTRSEPTLVERLMENIQLIGIGAGVLLVGLFGFFTWRRRKEEEEAMLAVEREMLAERELAEAPEIGQEDENLAALETMEAADNFDIGELDGVGTDDPISEAEIHLSLGQYDEAESKLLQGLEQDGQNVDARLMLLEVYAHQQNVDKFDDHYRQLLSISDGPAADRAARLRESIAGAPPFEAPAMDFSSESLEAAQLDDISASFEDDFASDSAASGELEGDTSLLDDLTMDLSDDLGGGAGAQDTQEAEDDFSLDLDLDLDGSLDGELPAEQGAEQAGADEEAFSLDDLDLGDLELGAEDSPAAASEAEAELAPIEYETPESDSADAESGADSGLEFDLDLSPMDDGSDLSPESQEAAAVDAPADSGAELSLDDISDDDLEAIGGELDGGLDLDAIDLDDISGLVSEEELARDGDPALTEQPEAQPVQAAEPSAVSDGEADLGDLNFNLESDLDSELNLLEGSDEVSTKLELAQAYLDMGDKDGAKDILSEVVQEGSGEHKARAEEMLERMA